MGQALPSSMRQHAPRGYRTETLAVDDQGLEIYQVRDPNGIVDIAWSPHGEGLEAALRILQKWHLVPEAFTIPVPQQTSINVCILILFFQAQIEAPEHLATLQRAMLSIAADFASLS